MEEFYDFDVEGDLKPKVAEIEAFLLERMAGDNLLFAKAWLEKLASELNFQDHEASLDKFERLYRYVKARERIDKAKKMKFLLKKRIMEEADGAETD